MEETAKVNQCIRQATSYQLGNVMLWKSITKLFREDVRKKALITRSSRSHGLD